MPELRRIAATFLAVTAAREGGVPGVRLRFRPEQARLGTDRIDDFAALGPDRTVSAIEGMGKVLRILRAARVALPTGAPLALQEHEAERLLLRAVGTRLVLELLPRSRLRFVAWTDHGIEEVEDVLDVIEAEDAFLVYRRAGRLPVRLPRPAVVRHATRCERWWQVVGIDRGR